MLAAASIPAPFFRYDVECLRPATERGRKWAARLARADYALRHVPGAHWLIETLDRRIERAPVWSDGFTNLVTTAGKTDLIDKYFKGSAYTAAWFLGLKGTGTAAVGDTLASHATWAEVNPYTGNRPAITFGTTSGGSNTASAVSYAITLAGPTTVAGAFVASANTGTAGTLYSAGDFAASRSVVSGDTLNVTLTVSAT